MFLCALVLIIALSLSHHLGWQPRWIVGRGLASPNRTTTFTLSPWTIRPDATEDSLRNDPSYDPKLVNPE